MTRKCTLCGEDAEFRIKGGSEHYCLECASMQFGDVSLLVKIDNDMKNLKKRLDDENFQLNIDD